MVARARRFGESNVLEKKREWKGRGRKIPLVPARS